MRILQSTFVGMLAVAAPSDRAVTRLRDAVPRPPDAFAHLRDDFDGGPSDPALRLDPWLSYKPMAIGTATVLGGALELEPVHGGTGPMGSLWYTANPGFQLDGLLLYKSVGPAEGTPTGFDARARLVVSSTMGAVPDQYRYAVLAVHDPDRSHLNYVHVGVGWDPNAASVETKTTDQDGGMGESVYVATELAEPLEVDVRIVRRSSDVQVFDTYYRPVSLGAPLHSNAGWTLHGTVDRSDGDSPLDTMPSRPSAVPLPNDVDVGVSVYASPPMHDVAAQVVEFWIGETTS